MLLLVWIKNRYDAGQYGSRTGGMKDTWQDIFNAGQEKQRASGMQDKRNAEKEGNAGKELWGK